MRIYDPRLGRFLSTDPLSGKYPWISPYAFAINNPIALVDFEGSEGAAPPNENNAPGQIVNIMVVSASLYTKNGDNAASYFGALQGMLTNSDASSTLKVIFANDAKDAYTQIYNIKAKGVTIGNIILESHGNGGESFDVGKSNFSAKNSGTDPWLKKIGAISSGAVVLTGCQLGMNEKLMKNLAKNTGKYVYADKGENTDWPGMFNDENDREAFANGMATMIWNTPQGKSYILKEANKINKYAEKSYNFIKKYGTDGMRKKFDEYLIKEATKVIMTKMTGVISPSSALEYITSPDHDHYDLRIKENVEKFKRGGQWVGASPTGTITSHGLLYFDKTGFVNFSSSTFSQTTWGAFIVELIKLAQPAAPIP